LSATRTGCAATSAEATVGSARGVTLLAARSALQTLVRIGTRLAKPGRWMGYDADQTFPKEHLRIRRA
jgi:hypothetical protein